MALRFRSHHLMLVIALGASGLSSGCDSSDANQRPDAGKISDAGSGSTPDLGIKSDRASSPDEAMSPDRAGSDQRAADSANQPDRGRDSRSDSESSDLSAPSERAGDSVQPADALPGGEGGVAGPQLMGRFDQTDLNAAKFGWSGSAVVARFQGTGVQINLDGSPNQFAVIIDGAVASTLKTTSSGKSYTVSASAGTHDLVLWRRTEGSQGNNRFVGLTAQGGQLLAPPARPDRRIELYGDSISAGYGIEGKDQNCSFSQDTENNYLAYGSVAARALNAEIHSIVWSGIGMYRNYGVSDASPDAMPAVFARTLPDANDPGAAWDFSSWQPQAVVINLGTNDASTHGDPGQPYRDAYLKFVRGLRQRYPDTFFVLTIGPMLSGDQLTAIKGHIQAVIQTRAGEGDTSMSFLEFPAQTGSDGYGCDWHPSIATNAKMADLLVAEIRTRLGW